MSKTVTYTDDPIGDTDEVAADTLLTSHDRNKALLAVMPDIVFGLSREGKILYHNAPDEGDLYSPPEQFLGKMMGEVIPHHIGVMYQECIQRSLETGQIQQFEYPMTVPKGVQEFECRMVSSGADEVLAIVRNITRRKGAETKLRESEEKFRSIANTATDCIFIKNRDRRYTFVNPAMEKILGLPEEGILGKSPEEIFGPEEARTVEEVDARAFSGEAVDEMRILLVGGTERVFHTLQTPLTAEDGKVTSIMGIVRDMTARKEAEKRDLHDNVCQQLAGLRFLLGGLRRALSETNPESADRVAHIETVAGDALRAARKTTDGPEYLPEDPDALVTALQKLARRVSDLYDVRCRYTSRKPVLIQNPGMATHLLLLAREAVSNAVVHAECSQIEISLSERNRSVTLAIRDNGIGFSPAKENRGMGLDTMRSRAAIIGASFDIQAGEAGGTVVTCSWMAPPKD